MASLEPRTAEQAHGVVGSPRLGSAGRRDLRPLLARRPAEGRAVSAVEIAGLILVIGMGVYLLVALLAPEKFQ